MFSVIFRQYLGMRIKKKKRTHKRATGEQEELVQILNSEH